MNKEVKILNRGRREEIKELLKKKYDVEINEQYHLIQWAKDKLRIFTGDLNANDLIRLNNLINIETIGLYFASFDMNVFRLGFDASMIYGKNAKKNVILLDDIESVKWLYGQDILKETKEEGFVIMKNGDDILGIGMATRKKILNFVPKERRTL